MPRKMPRIEREARRQKMDARLVGLKLEGELDVSHALFDLVMQVKDDDALAYVPLIRCTKRDQEVLGKKKAIDFKDYEADVATIHKLYKAFQRRALAFEMAELCLYETQMLVIDRYMEIMDMQPIDNHDRVTIGQILDADEATFVEMA